MILMWVWDSSDVRKSRQDLTWNCPWSRVDFLQELWSNPAPTDRCDRSTFLTDRSGFRPDVCGRRLMKLCIMRPGNGSVELSVGSAVLWFVSLHILVTVSARVFPETFTNGKFQIGENWLVSENQGRDLCGSWWEKADLFSGCWLHLLQLLALLLAIVRNKLRF